MTMERRGTGVLIGATMLLGLGFVVCLVLAIMFRHQVDKAKADAANAYAAIGRLATPEELRGELIRSMLQTQTEHSVVHQLLDENNRLKRYILGSSEVSIGAIQSRMAELGVVDGEFLVREVIRTRAQLVEARELQARYEQRTRSESQRAAAAHAAMIETQRKLDQEIRKNRAQSPTPAE